MPSARPIAQLRSIHNVCWRCCPQLPSRPSRRRFSRTSTSPTALHATRLKQRPPSYFLSNSLLETVATFSTKGFFTQAIDARPQLTSRSAATGARTPGGSSALTATTAAISSDAEKSELLPHRQRQRSRQRTADDVTANTAHSRSFLRRTLPHLLALSKPRLTVLVVLTAVVPYALYPTPDLLLDLTSSAASTSAAASAPSLSPTTLLSLALGTALTSASANALNMLYEPATDALMSRTRTRPLARASIPRSYAALFAVATGVAGGAVLFYGVNPTVAALGLGNIALYAGAYTPMKRVSAANTWVGALVGAIPPLMGWAAGAGEVEGAGVGAVGGGKGGWRELLFNFPGLTSGGFGTDGVAAAVTAPPSTAGWVLAALLFAWQFPHFCALSHPIRDEYRAAGLRMLAWTNPARNARVSLRYALLLFPLCVALAYPPDFLTGPGNSGAGGGAVVEPSFAWTTAPVNVWIAWQAARFWWAVRQSKAAAGTAAAAAGSIAGGGPGRFGIARGLFWASVWYLPLVLVLAMAQKKGLWSRLRRGLTGADHLPEDDERWEDEDEEE